MTYHPLFPVALQPAAAALLRVLQVGELAPPMPGFTVLVQGEQMSVPDRVYYAPHRLRSVIASSSGDTRAFALSLGTRHCDGYLREECLQHLLATDRPWVVPFVVKLVGEYVFEIVEVVAAALPELNHAHFAEFVRENPAFMATTRRRVISYWDCYYRGRFPSLQTYPALATLDAIERMAADA